MLISHSSVSWKVRANKPSFEFCRRRGNSLLDDAGFIAGNDGNSSRWRLKYTRVVFLLEVSILPVHTDQAAPKVT